MDLLCRSDKRRLKEYEYTKSLPFRGIEAVCKNVIGKKSGKENLCFCGKKL